MPVASTTRISIVYTRALTGMCERSLASQSLLYDVVVLEERALADQRREPQHGGARPRHQSRSRAMRTCSGSSSGPRLTNVFSALLERAAVEEDAVAAGACT